MKIASTLATKQVVSYWQRSAQSYVPFQCGCPPYYYGHSSNIYPQLLPCQPQLQLHHPLATVTFIAGNITVLFRKKQVYKEYVIT